MKRKVYFSMSLMTLLLLLVATISSYAQEEEEILIKETILTEGEEVKLPVNCDAFVQVDFIAKNLGKEKSVFWRSSYFEGEELPETEIGPIKFRTYELGPGSSDRNKKVITLDCEGVDELLFHVSQGKVHLTVIGRTTY